MNPTEQFFESRIHTNHKVFGRKLRALCLLDILALEAIDSPFVRGGNVSPEDVAVAVNLLSRPVKRDLSIDVEFANPGFLLKLAAVTCSVGKLQREVAKLEAYISDYMTSPELWRCQSGDTTPLGAPWIQTLITFLLRETNLSQTEIWTQPVGAVLWIAATLEEQLTQSRIKTQNDIESEKSAAAESVEIEKLKSIEIKMLQDAIANGLSGEDLEKTRRRLSKLLGS